MAWQPPASDFTQPAWRPPAGDFSAKSDKSKPTQGITVSDVWNTLKGGAKGVGEFFKEGWQSGQTQDMASTIWAALTNPGRKGTEAGGELVGGLLAGAGAFVGEPLVPPSGRMVAGAARTAPQKLLQDFETVGMTPSAPIIGGGRATGLATNLARSLPFSPVQKNIGRTFEEAQGAAQRLGSQYGTAATPEGAGNVIESGVQRTLSNTAKAGGRIAAAASTPEEAGTAARTGLNRFAEDRTQADREYGEFFRLMHGAPPAVLTNTVQTLRQLMGKYPNAPELEGVFEPPPIARMARALEPRQVEVPAQTSSILGPNGLPIVRTPAQLIQRGGALSFQELKELRTNIGYKLENPSFGPEGIPKGDLKRLYAALSADMQRAAQAQGPGAVRALATATANYRARTDILERLEPLIKPAAPEQTFARINQAALGKDAGLLRTAKRVLSPSEWGNISSTIVDRLGAPAAGSKLTFSPGNFAKNWDKLSDGAKDELFGLNRPNSPRASLENLAARAGVQTQIEDLISGPPARIFERINQAAAARGGNIGLLQQTRRSMSSEEWGDLGATIVNHLTQPPAGSASRFSLASYATNWNKMSGASKDVLFGADSPGSPRAGLEALARIGNNQKVIGKLENFSHSGEVVTAYRTIETILASIAAGRFPWATAAGVSGAYFLSHVMMKPGFARWLYGLPRVIKGLPEGQAETTAATALQRALAMPEEPRRERPPSRPRIGEVGPQGGRITAVAPAL